LNLRPDSSDEATCRPALSNKRKKTSLLPVRSTSRASSRNMAASPSAASDIQAHLPRLSFEAGSMDSIKLAPVLRKEWKPLLPSSHGDRMTY